MGVRSEPSQRGADGEIQLEGSITRSTFDVIHTPEELGATAEEIKQSEIAKLSANEDIATSNEQVYPAASRLELEQTTRTSTSKFNNLSHDSVATSKTTPITTTEELLQNNTSEFEYKSIGVSPQPVVSTDDENENFKSTGLESALSKDSTQVSILKTVQNHFSTSTEITIPGNEPSTDSSKNSSPELKSMSHDSMATLKSPMFRTSTVSMEKSSATAASSLPQNYVEKPEDEPILESLQSGEDKNENLNSTGSDSTITRQSIASKESMKLQTIELSKDESRNSENKSLEKLNLVDANAVLLERLEQENKMHVTNTRSGSMQVSSPTKEGQSDLVIPSNIQILKSSTQSSSPSLRYSKIPPPPMTELEFWGALVKDHKTTAHRLPTLTTKKIRNGVPAPLRGVVWHSISGARDPDLASQYDRLCGEPSPYDGIIGKDLGRSFPGIEMFRDPQGDGQKMLGKVLKCLSLYDDKIGYCQGLAFIVGPFLMHMGDQQAFCVLVRLLGNFDMRSCFLPDLSGLHMRIFQFRQLLKQHLPNLSRHLDDLQIEPAYVSQWFLTIFAVSCPLPLLFRIYDVIFAEGAVNTIMRVALSLMRKNEQKIMAHTEFEDVMQLLLSRSLWDVYHYNADEFVNDFVGLSDMVTPEILQSLELGYRAQASELTTSPSNAGSKATQFPGKSWTGPNKAMKPTSPRLTTPSHSKNLLRRSSSKQSIASTLNSIGGSGTDSTISFSTVTTSISRVSSNTDMSSILTQSVSFNQATKTNKDLHSQIEDLLTALSELQRENAIVATQLQKEREDRDDDRIMVQTLLDRLKSYPDFCDDSESTNSLPSMGEKIKEDQTCKLQIQTPNNDDSAEIQMSSLLKIMELRFSPQSKRPSSLLQTKSQLREDLHRAKEQLAIETSKAQSLSSNLSKQDQEITELREQSKKLNVNLYNAETENQKLIRQLKDLRKEHAVNNRDNSTASVGLRELRLGRPNSRNPPTSHSKRVSSLSASSNISSPTRNPEFHTQASDSSIIRGAGADNENDAESLILELVQAKTSEAIARQEADELRNRLDSLRKLLDAPVGVRSNPNQSLSAGISNYFSGSKTESKVYSLPPKPSSVPPKVSALPPALSAPQAQLGNSVAAVTGFLGGWGKRAIGNSFGS